MSLGLKVQGLGFMFCLICLLCGRGFAFWHAQSNSLRGPQILPQLQRDGLESAVKSFSKVKLFCWAPVKNVPEGVEICDASEHLDFDVARQLLENGRMASC